AVGNSGPRCERQPGEPGGGHGDGGDRDGGRGFGRGPERYDARDRRGDLHESRDHRHRRGPDPELLSDRAHGRQLRHGHDHGRRSHPVDRDDRAVEYRAEWRRLRAAAGNSGPGCERQPGEPIGGDGDGGDRHRASGGDVEQCHRQHGGERGGDVQRLGHQWDGGELYAAVRKRYPHPGDVEHDHAGCRGSGDAGEEFGGQPHRTSGHAAAAWAVTWRPGTVSASVKTTTSTSNATGTAATTWTLGPGAGTQTVQAAGAGSTVAFSATATAGAATQLTITTQPSSTAQSGVAFAQQPVIQVRDASGNAVSQRGVTVTAAIATGAGTLGGTLTATTDGKSAA